MESCRRMFLVSSRTGTAPGRGILNRAPVLIGPGSPDPSGEGNDCARVAKLADAQGLKSCGGSPSVWVRLPPRALLQAGSLPLRSFPGRFGWGLAVASEIRISPLLGF